MNPNREFHELVGLCWCEPEYFDCEPEYYDTDFDKCPKCGAIYSCSREFTKHPDYAADPRLVLREMKRMGKLSAFMIWLWDADTTEDDLGNVLMAGESFLKLLDFILDESGILRGAAIKFIRKEEKDE